MPSRSAVIPLFPPRAAGLAAAVLWSAAALAGPDGAGAEGAPGGHAPEQPGIARFMKIRAPSNARLSPDGSLYVRDWPDGVNQLHRREPGADPASAMTRLTDFRDGVSGFAVSPDGGSVALS